LVPPAKDFATKDFKPRLVLGWNIVIIVKNIRIVIL
jgi:hypothetical protein